MNTMTTRMMDLLRSARLLVSRHAPALCALAVLAPCIPTVYAQDPGDYRSLQSGDWNDPNTWEQWNGSAWITEYPVYTPDSVFGPNDGYPIVAGSATSAKTTNGAGDHVVALPPDIAAGDLILIFWTDANGNHTVNTPAGYTQLYSNTSGNLNRRAWYKVADGTEGTSLVVANNNERSAHTSYRILAGSYQGVPVASGADTGTDDEPDPPNLTSGFGAVPTMWLATSHSAGDNSVTAPTDYTANLIVGHSGNTGNGHATTGTSYRFTTAASENPGAFDLGGNRVHAAWTVAIRGLAIESFHPHPVVMATATGAQSGSDVASHPITIPAGDAGDLLVAVFSVDGDPTVSTVSSGWTKLGQASNGSTVTGAIFWKMASGTTPAADALSLTTSANERSSHITYRIRGATGISGSASNGSSANSNPPSHTAPEASWLWMATRSGDGNTVASAPPSDYTGLITQAAGNGNGASTNTAIRVFDSAPSGAQDPGNFTSGNEQWVCWTLAIQGPDSLVSYTPIDVPAMTGTGGDGYPSVASTATSAKTVDTGTTHTVSLPSGIEAGDLLLIFWADANTSGTQPATPAGWTALYSGQWGSSNVYYRAWYRIADGSEGSTVNVTGGAERSAHTAYRIASGSFQGVPVASPGNTGTTNSNPDPDNLTSGFGNVPTLWIAAAHITGTIWVTPPASYGNILEGTTGSTGVAHAYMATAERMLTAASQNPGAFTIDTDHSWGAYTVAVQGMPPVPGTLATIRNGHTVTVDSEASIDDLTVESGGTLDLGSEKLTVNGGSVVVNGDISGTAGELVLGGPANKPMSVTGTGDIDVYDVTANTVGGVTMNPDLGIRGTLQLDNGTFTAVGNVKLISTASGTGRLGPVASGAGYSGNLTMERYIPAGHTNWRMLGSAVAGQTIQKWKDDFLTAGFPGSHYPTFDDPVGSGILWPSIRWYDETVVSSDPDDGVVGVSSNTQPLAVGQGFLAWCGDNLTSTAAFTVDVTGAPTIAQSPVTLPMSFTSSGDVNADGWNLVGNPLPSPIDFEAISRGNDVRNAYWIFDPVAGNNKAWTGGIGQGSLNGKIQSSQAFWVKADGTDLTTTVDEGAKVNQPTGGTFGGSQVAVLPVLSLHVASGLNSYSDEATIVFADGSPAYGGNDALKMTFKTVGAPQIGVRSSGGELLSVDFFGTYNEAIQIPLDVDVDVTGTYTITAAFAGFNSLGCLTLVDQLTGTATPLTDGASYTFSITADDQGNASRFVINGTKPVALYVDHAPCFGQDGAGGVISNEGPIDLVWTDAFGNTLLHQGAGNSSGDYFQFNAPAGNYMVYMSPAGACGQVSASFTITEPPAIGSSVATTATTCPNGDDGTAAVSATGGTGPYTFLWNNGATTAEITGPAGAYTVTVTDANGCMLPLEVAVPAGEGAIAGFALNGEAVAGVPMVFSNTSVLADQYFWDFGDGQTSTEEAPAHTWALPGEYTVALTASDEVCSDTFTMTVIVGIGTGIGGNDGGDLHVWATPDHIVIAHPFGSAPMDVDVHDATGRLVLSRTAISKPDRIALDDRKLSTGVWFVRVTSGKTQRTFRVPLVR